MSRISGRVNLVFNNAGVALASTVEGLSYEDAEWIFNINFWGVVYGTKAFLPYLKQSGSGPIVNISSAIWAHWLKPTQSAYNATKFAVRGFYRGTTPRTRPRKLWVSVQLVFTRVGYVPILPIVLE